MNGIYTINDGVVLVQESPALSILKIPKPQYLFYNILNYNSFVSNVNKKACKPLNKHHNMILKKSYIPLLLLVTLTLACKNQSIDIEKERQNAVTEYINQIEAERNKKLDAIKQFYAVFATGDMSVLPEILAANYTQYPADPGQTPDIKGFIKHANDFAAMFSDLSNAPSHIIIDKEYAFVRSELEVTHAGEAFNIPATNKRIKITAFDLHHFNEEGKIDKTWHLEDFWGAYTQISE